MKASVIILFRDLCPYLINCEDTIPLNARSKIISDASTEVVYACKLDKNTGQYFIIFST